VNVTILYFAAIRDLVGKDEERVELPGDIATIVALAAHLPKLHPQLEGRLGYVRFARNEEFAQNADPIAEGDVIALIPPVAGG
jgi:molybdopterin synthase sulfur carrier subunit